MTTGSVVTSTAVTSDGTPADTSPVADADVRDGSKQLRDIEDLIAKLAIVTQQLAVPARTMTAPRHADAGQPAAREN